MALLTAGYVGSMLFFCMFYRFRIPAVPFLTVLASAGIIAMVQLFRSRQFLKGTLLSVTAAMIFILTWDSPVRRRDSSEMCNTAAVMIRLGQLARAEKYIETLRAENKSEKELELYFLRNLYQSGDKQHTADLLKKWQEIPVK